jgi:hypothetical protein
MFSMDPPEINFEAHRSQWSLLRLITIPTVLYEFYFRQLWW